MNLAPVTAKNSIVAAILEAFPLSSVMQVYSGRPGCMCGCRGTYRYASAHRAAGTRNRGYEVEDGEVNDRQVRRVYEIIAEAEPSQLEVDPAGSYVVREFDGRVYAAYLAK